MRRNETASKAKMRRARSEPRGRPRMDGQPMATPRREKSALRREKTPARRKPQSLAETDSRMFPAAAVLAGMKMAQEVKRMVMDHMPAKVKTAAPPAPQRGRRARVEPVIEPAAIAQERKGSAVAVSAPRQEGTMNATTATAAPMIGNTFLNKGPSVKRRTIRTLEGTVRGGWEISNTEPVMTLSGTAEFRNLIFVMNPANSALFAWLSRIAPNYDLYKFEEFVLEFKTEEPASTKGRVGIMYDYEATDEAPSDRITFEAQKAAKVSTTWENLSNAMNPVVASRAAYYYVADSTDSGGDPRVTDQALVNVMTADCGDTGVNGELFVRYKVVLIEPTLTNAASSAFTSSLLMANADVPKTSVSDLNIELTQKGAEYLPGEASAIYSAALVPGSSNAGGFTLQCIGLTSTTAAFRMVWLPPATQKWTASIAAAGGNVYRAGSYLVSAIISFTGGGNFSTAVTSASGTPIGCNPHTTQWNDTSTAAQDFGNGVTSTVSTTSAQYHLRGRFDILAVPASAGDPGPRIDLDMTGTTLNAGFSVNGIIVYVVPLSGTAGTGPQLTVVSVKRPAGSAPIANIKKVYGFGGPGTALDMPKVTSSRSVRARQVDASSLCTDDAVDDAVAVEAKARTAARLAYDAKYEAPRRAALMRTVEEDYVTVTAANTPTAAVRDSVPMPAYPNLLPAAAARPLEPYVPTRGAPQPAPPKPDKPDADPPAAVKYTDLPGFPFLVPSGAPAPNGAAPTRSRSASGR